jgi:hypothetical protein
MLQARRQMIQRRKSILRLDFMVLLLASVLATQAPNVSAADNQGKPGLASSVPEIIVLSNRADLISGGDALVEIKWQAASVSNSAKIELNGTDVMSAFSTRADGRYIGLVTGLNDGENTLTVHVGGAGFQITITNHPITGPVISGPQLTPYECRTIPNGLGAQLDENCSAATLITYYYRTNTDSFELLADPTERPDDLVDTTTTEGDTVPYIVRVEAGTINRGVYRLAMLDAPVEGGGAFTPGPGWNQKLVVTFGGGGSAQYNQGVSSDASVLRDMELSRGFAFMASTELVNHQHANPHLQAETLMMLKEHFIEQIGIPKWTAGVGGSGGAIQQYMIAQLYPGLLDGLQPGYSFPETAMPDVWECRLLHNVFQSDPARWTEDKQVAIQGFNANTCLFWHFFFASIMESDHAPGCAVTEQANIDEIYNPTTNPTGSLRCDIFQTNANLLGTNLEGSALRPMDNVGVQYGLAALNNGDISVTDFLDFNEQVGGFDQDGNAQAARHEADLEALHRAYEGGLINSFSGLAELPVPIITHRNNATNVGDIHDTLQDLIVRARLERLNGNADNQIIWTGSFESTIAGVDINALAIDLMNDWLDNIAADPIPASIDKIVANKPADAVDACWDKSGNIIVEIQSTDPDAACNLIYPRFSTPRVTAGEQLTRDAMKCQLMSVSTSDYSVSLTPEDEVRLNSIFPTGVCDFSLPGEAQTLSLTWTAWADGAGFVPLDDAPVSGE